MNVDKCNGWSNPDTWNAHLWLTNDPETFEAARRRKSPLHLRLYFEQYFRKKDNIDTSKVNWTEIYRALEGYNDAK